MRRDAFVYAAAMGLMLLAPQRGGAAVIARYEFGTVGQETTSETSAAYSATTVLPGASATAISDPAGTIGIEISSAATTPASAPYLRIDPQGSSTSAAVAVTNNKYFQFTVAATGANTLTISSLDFLVARGGGSTPRGYAVRSSADGFATNIATADVATTRPNWTTLSIPLSGAGYSNLSSSTPLTFRVYSYSPGGGSSVDYDNITVQGVVPEPVSLTLLAVPAAGLLMRRRRA